MTIFRARFVVTMDGPPIENAAVVVSEDFIRDVGPVGEVRKNHSGDVVDLGERVLFPGLINAHCHLDYTCLRGKIPPPNGSFTDWIRAINAAKAALSSDDYIKSINDGMVEANRFGTGALVNLTAFPEVIGSVVPILPTRWLAELIDVRSAITPEKMVAQALESLKALGASGLAPHAPFTASPELYRCCAEHDRPLSTHLAESRDEMRMFRDAAGPLYDFMEGIGRDMSDCGQQTPLARFLSFADVEHPWIIAHLNELTESDFALLAEIRPNFSIVHCPRSHRYFDHTPFPFAKLKALGFPVCLGTDSLASNEDLSLFAEMRAFQQNFGGIDPDDILAMTTCDAAECAGYGGVYGRITAGYRASLLAVPFNGAVEQISETIINFEDDPWTRN